MKGIDLFVKNLVFVKILSESTRKEEFQSLEVREQAPSRLKSIGAQFTHLHIPSLCWETIVIRHNLGHSNTQVPTQQDVHPNIVISSVFLGEFITCILIYLLHTCIYSMKHFFTARCLTFLRTTLTKRRSPHSTVRFLGPAKNRTMRNSYQLSSTYTEFNQFCRLPYL